MLRCSMLLLMLLLSQDEISKASRILKAVTTAPETEEMAEGKEAMHSIMSVAEAFIFMTTVKVGGLLSGMGGSGILGKSRLLNAV